MKTITYKKVFQSNANHPLAASPNFTVNKLKHVLGVVGTVGWGRCTLRSKLNKFENV